MARRSSLVLRLLSVLVTVVLAVTACSGSEDEEGDSAGSEPVSETSGS